MAILGASPDGLIADIPGYAPLAQNGASIREPEPDEITPMPAAGHFYFLPERFPFALKKGAVSKVEALPVAAILPQGYTRTLLPAYGPETKRPWLPYFGYTACFPKNGSVYVAALPTQADPKWEKKSFPQRELRQRIKERLAANPENRVLSQVALCAADYHCYTAANVFFRRWEGALPVSPSCNAFCRGCISKAVDAGPPSPQDRFAFIPTVEECVAIARDHFAEAPEPIISFGQGCEGEPTLQAALIEKVVSPLRQEFPRGQFNINTNGSRPRVMEKLFRAGVDSIRVSLNATREDWYDAYYRPTHYRLADVRETVRIAKGCGAFVSLNLLCFPGVTDHPGETEKFFSFLDELKPDLIQMRNLNIDPWCYIHECIRERVSGIGMARWLSLLIKTFPSIRVGNHTPYIKSSPASRRSGYK